MNEQLQKELAAWLAQLRDAAQQGAGFAIEQAPQIVREKILITRIESTLWMCVGIAIGVGAFLWMRRYVAAVRADEGQSFEVLDLNPGVVVPGVIAVIGGAVMVATNASVALTAWFAPRLLITEWLAGFLK